MKLKSGVRGDPVTSEKRPEVWAHRLIDYGAALSPVNPLKNHDLAALYSRFFKSPALTIMPS